MEVVMAYFNVLEGPRKTTTNVRTTACCAETRAWVLWNVKQEGFPLSYNVLYFVVVTDEIQCFLMHIFSHFVDFRPFVFSCHWMRLSYSSWPWSLSSITQVQWNHDRVSMAYDADFIVVIGAISFLTYMCGKHLDTVIAFLWHFHHNKWFLYSIYYRNESASSSSVT
jgi:hypothetical protein